MGGQWSFGMDFEPSNLLATPRDVLVGSGCVDLRHTEYSFCRDCDVETKALETKPRSTIPKLT